MRQAIIETDMETLTIPNIPQWAATYLLYGDDSGLTVEDVQTVREYTDGLWRDEWRLLAPIDGTNNEFCARPEFGKPCAVQD